MGVAIGSPSCGSAEAMFFAFLEAGVTVWAPHLLRPPRPLVTAPWLFHTLLYGFAVGGELIFCNESGNVGKGI